MGNATLFDGTVVETTTASSELALRNGVKVSLARDRAPASGRTVWFWKKVLRNWRLRHPLMRAFRIRRS